MIARPATVLLVLVGVLTGCGNGGAGDGRVRGTFPSTLVAASFDGARLLLVFSDGIALTGAQLDDDDLSLTGGSLGAVAQPPTVVDLRTLAVDPGSGAQLVAGTTTIGFRSTTDAVVGLGDGNPPATDSVTVVSTDADAPRVERLTASGVDDALSGGGPAGGTLQVPVRGFTIDARWSDASSTIDPDLCALFCDRAVSADGAVAPAGTNLTRFLPRTLIGFAAPGIGGASWFVPPGVSFPTGDSTLTALVVDASGQPADARSFQLRAVVPDAGIRPFETRQVWYLSFERDVEQFEVRTAPLQAAILGQSNGRQDAFDALWAIGLWADAPLPNVRAGLNSNAVVRARLEERLAEELDVLLEGANVAFTFDAPGTFPATRDSVPYDQLDFSQICIAGAPAPTPRGTLGAALYDPNNQTQNDNCIVDFDGQRLGIFVHTLVNFGLRSGPSSTFRQTFDPFTAAVGGTPIGGDTEDGARLSGARTDARRDAIDVAIMRISRAIAVVIAHECGHSMGLVANGPMPTGLYGGDATNFPTPAASASLHIDNRRLFPPGSQNVMSAAIDFDATLSPDTGFNSLNRAYLNERALYDRR